MESRAHRVLSTDSPTGTGQQEAVAGDQMARGERGLSAAALPAGSGRGCPPAGPTSLASLTLGR